MVTFAVIEAALNDEAAPLEGRNVFGGRLEHGLLKVNDLDVIIKIPTELQSRNDITLSLKLQRQEVDRA